MRLSLVILVAVVLTPAAHAASDPPIQTFFNSGSRQVSVSPICWLCLCHNHVFTSSACTAIIVISKE
jgi:hypothetical protein